jgi:hypothetical protein
MVEAKIQSDHALVGRIFLGVAPLLRTRVFRSPDEPEPRFQAMLGTPTDALVLFTKGSVSSAAPGQISPRQSFRYDARSRSVQSFDQFVQILA